VQTLPPITYLSVDPVSEGIGLSQVVRYVERLGRRGLDVTLHSFEQGAPSPAVAQRLRAAGVRWRPHRFGMVGAAGGMVRVAHAASLVARADLVHARSDLAAAASLLAQRRRWVWDLRALWREQRIAAGMMREGSAPERLMRSVEAASARSCTSIVTLSHSVVEVLAERYGPEVAGKANVITTCVDLDLFALAPLPPLPPVRLLLSGTVNKLYDVPSMLKLLDRLSTLVPTELTVLAPGPTPWEASLATAGAVRTWAQPEAMPSWVKDHHVGLSVLRDVGVSNRAAVPTKLGEFLACGRPVVVNPGVGDIDALLAANDCGVVLQDDTEAALEAAAHELLRLLGDPETPARCRALATRHFDLERGVDELVEVYAQAAT
jgi:glycosyltransferase involved in cell wall biosynthesis